MSERAYKHFIFILFRTTIILDKEQELFVLRYINFLMDNMNNLN